LEFLFRENQKGYDPCIDDNQGVFPNKSKNNPQENHFGQSQKQKISRAKLPSNPWKRNHGN